MNKKETSQERDILFGEYATRSFVNAVSKFSTAVTKTLGPCGSYVAIDQGHGRTRITKDGVTVAKALSSSNKFENMALNIVKESCIKANSVVGDSTTTSITLLAAIISEGHKVISAGHQTKHVVNGLEKASEQIKKIIMELSREAQDEDLKHIATISANNDVLLGELIHSAVQKINGKYGVINVEESKSTETKLEFSEGMKFSKGYLSPYFVNQQEYSQVDLEDVAVLITNGKIGANHSEFFYKFLEYISMSSKSALVICEDLEKQLLGTMIVNNYKGNIRAVAVRAPDFGDDRMVSLQDIALLTGGMVIEAESSHAFSDFSSDVLGSCKRVIVQKDSTSIIDGYGNKGDLQQRIADIKNTLDSQIELSEYARDKLKERYSRLTGGVATIKVGGATESELSEKKDRVIDSVSAVRSTYENGYVVGGGICHLNAAKLYVKRDLYSSLDEKERNGAKILINALKSPIVNILLNGGFEHQVIINKILEQENLDFGFDALNGEFCDLKSRGIIDSAKSALTALDVAVSLGVIALNTQVCISKITKD